jgi:hypothetical protein
MTQTSNQQTKQNAVDISKINRNGSFLCPNCKTRISPDDHSETTYTIYEIVAVGSSLQELVLYCKNCCSFIHLKGFSNVTKTGNSISVAPME